MKPNTSPVSAFAMYSKLKDTSNNTSLVSKHKVNLTKKGKNNKRNKGRDKVEKTNNNTNGDLKVNMKAKNKKNVIKNASKKSIEMALADNLKAAQKEKKIVPVVTDITKVENLKKAMNIKINNKKVKNKKTTSSVPVPDKIKLNESDDQKTPNIIENSVTFGEEIFTWLIQPYDLKDFFEQKWEKLPLIIKRNKPDYYSWLISCEEINKALRKDTFFFTKNIDITSYSPETGVRETHNPPGRANAPLVWDYYANGCSVRLLNPQTYFKKIHQLTTTLQEFFECFVGANLYLTPPGTQGFAPHYDDIEAFVIQIEGEKLWKVYAPRTPAEVLPRFSSGNFTEADIGTPILEILLKAGDMLYFPRGFIHQGTAQEHTHSLHITLSMYQKNSWADLFETLLPAALKCAIEEDVSFRQGLPLHSLSNMGIVNSNKDTSIRAQFMEKAEQLFSKLFQHAPIDAAVDQIGKKFIHDALPPSLSDFEKERTAFGDGEVIVKGVIKNQAEMCLGTRIKLLRYNCIRVIKDDDNFLKIYYSVDNSKEYHAEEPQFLEIDIKLADAVDTLISSYPNFITVEDLPIDDEICKVQLAKDLWEQGILMTEDPLAYDSE